MSGNVQKQSRASLVERLVDLNPKTDREIRPLRTLTREGLKASVSRNLFWILNTRVGDRKPTLSDEELTVIDFGIPDFGVASPENPEDRIQMERAIQRAVSAFEPRLRYVRVHAQTGIPDEKTMYIDIAAELVSESVREPISFRTVFHQNTGKWGFHGFIS